MAIFVIKEFKRHFLYSHELLQIKQCPCNSLCVEKKHARKYFHIFYTYGTFRNWCYQKISILSLWFTKVSCIDTCNSDKIGMLLLHFMLYMFNSLGPSEAIWWHRSGSTLAQVMACCLTAPSHCLNQRWLMISEVLWHSTDSNFTENTQDIYLWNEFEIYQSETVVKSPRGQWVN